MTEKLVLIPVHSPQDLTPQIIEVIRAICDSHYPDHIIKFIEASTDDKKILVFGSQGPYYANDRQEFVYTYSLAQIMSKANAGTILGAALGMFVNEQIPIPILRPISLMTVGSLQFYQQWDFEAPICIDIETNGNLGDTHTPEDVDIISIAFYQPSTGTNPLVLNFGTLRGVTAGFSELKAKMPSSFRDLAGFMSSFKCSIYHNGKFDVRVINRVLGTKLTPWFDTMLAHHVINMAAGDHKLKSLCKKYFNAPDWEKDLKRYTKGGGHYEFIPVNLLIKYNGWDVYWTYRLYEFLSPQLFADEFAASALQLEMAAAEFLLKVELYGVPFDTAYAYHYDAELTEQLAFQLGGLRDIAGEAFNPASPMQVRYFITNLGFAVKSTDEPSLRGLLDDLADFDTVPAEDAERFINLLLAYRKTAKILSTYVKGWTSKVRSGRVHPTFLVHGTSTGRLSSTSPNAQNVPRSKEIRKLVTTRG